VDLSPERRSASLRLIRWKRSASSGQAVLIRQAADDLTVSEQTLRNWACGERDVRETRMAGPGRAI
jgi:hypothetical protein